MSIGPRLHMCEAFQIVPSRQSRPTCEKSTTIRDAAGLIAAIEDRIADESFEGGVYLLADPSFTPVAGNLKVWPSTLKGSKGWGDFMAREWEPGATDRPALRGTFDTLPDGYHLLVGKDIDDLGEFAKKIETVLLCGVALIFVIAGVASVSVTRRTVGQIGAMDATSQAVHATRSRRPDPPARDTGRMGSTPRRENLNSMLGAP